MSNALVRLALVGSDSSTAAKMDRLRRVRDAIVTVTTDSIEAALHRDDGYDAAIVDDVDDARWAAERGKHVFIDAPFTDSFSPFADSFDRAEALIQVCQQAKVILAVGRLPKHSPACQAINDRLTSGKLGAPGMLRVHRWGCETERTLPSTVFGDIDLALHLFQSTPTEIYAIGREDHSYLQVHLSFPAGGMALLDFAQRLPSGQAYNSLSLIGATGAAYADDHHNTHLLFAHENPIALFSDSGTGRLHEFQQFVNHIAIGSSPLIHTNEILAAHRVTDAVRRSVESASVLRQRGNMYEPV